MSNKQARVVISGPIFLETEDLSGFLSYMDHVDSAAIEVSLVTKEEAFGEELFPEDCPNMAGGTDSEDDPI